MSSTSGSVSSGSFSKYQLPWATAPHPLQPFHQYGFLKFSFQNRLQHCVNGCFELPARLEVPATELLLQIREQLKITRGQVWAVSWMVPGGDKFRLEELHGCCRSVWMDVIMVQKPPVLEVVWLPFNVVTQHPQHLAV